MSNPKRVQAGVPNGGQFAADQHAEADVELTDTGSTSAGNAPASPAPTMSEIYDAAEAGLGEGRSGWAATNHAIRALGFTDSDTDEYRRAVNTIALAHGHEAVPYRAQAFKDLGLDAPSVAARKRAEGHRQEARDSFDRSDTDGFLSQHVSGLSANKAELQGSIDDFGGRASFVALADLDGNLVPAKMLSTRFGPAYGKLSDPEDPYSSIDGWVNLSKSTDPEKQRKYLADRGYKEVYVMAPAYADFGGGNGTGLGGMLSVRAVAVRKDGGFSRDVEILPDEMRYF